MTSEQFIALMKAFTEFVGVVIWPILILVILLLFRGPLGEFFRSLGEFSFKAPGVEASAKRKQVVEAAAAVGAAVATKSPAAVQSEAVLEEAKAAAGVVAKVATPRALRRLGEATVLWVDDQPDNNRYERQSMEALGVRFVLSTSTEDALTKTQQRAFDAIISDMGRPEDNQAGYTLLDTLRGRGDRTPFILYTSSQTPEQVAEARRHGAMGCTNRPQQVFEMVLQAVGKSSGSSGRSAEPNADGG